LRRLGRRRLLQLLILPLQRGVLALQLGVLTLQLGVFAFGDAAREEDSGSAEQEQDTTWQTPWYQSVISPLAGQKTRLSCKLLTLARDEPLQWWGIIACAPRGVEAKGPRT
jgi:hypothetical protein